MFKYVFALFGENAWNNGLVLKSGNSINIFVYLLIYLAVILIAYLLGSVNTAVVLSKLMYGEDIRTKGSGNAGMTNMMRTYGKGPAALTLLGDMLKTLLGMFFGTCMLGINGAYVAGLFCVLGHIAPVFYHFKGGKGVAATAMMILYIDWFVFLVMFVIFVLIVASTKYLSLASVMIELIFPLLLNRFDTVEQDRGLRLVITLAVMALVVYMHRSNIKRIMEGTENKFAFKKTAKKKANEPESEEFAEENTETVSDKKADQKIKKKNK